MITTATATKGDIGDYLDAIGTVTPVYTASIFSQVTGVVTKVNYQEGQIVKQGDPLVDIDDRQYQAQLVQAQGALERDQNVLAQAQMDLQRFRDGLLGHSVSPGKTHGGRQRGAGRQQAAVDLPAQMVRDPHVLAMVRIVTVHSVSIPELRPGRSWQDQIGRAHV